MYAEKTERLKTKGVSEGGIRLGKGAGSEDDGLINAIVFSCGSVATYLTGVDVQRWRAGPLAPPKKRMGGEKQQANQPFFILSFFFLLLPIGQLDCWHKLDGESLGRIQFIFFHFVFQEGQTVERPS